jgi:uncharacterized membrane protein YraQ (UPF0718 family)
MTAATLAALPSELRRRVDPAIAALVAIAVALAVFDRARLGSTLLFTLNALTSIAPWLALSVALAAGARATGADALVRRAFEGRPLRMIFLATLFGALSPFCSCGVVPVVAGLLAAGVPLAPVLAFCLASPLMDPSQFLLLSGTIGVGFAVAKTGAAILAGLLGGFGTLALTRAGWLGDEVVRVRKMSACATKQAAAPVAPVWRFWSEPERAQTFIVTAGAQAWFLGKILAVAFALESLMLAYIPAERVAGVLADAGGMAIPLAVMLGVPAYLNGLAAIPLVNGLIGLGVSPAVGLAFMVAGGVTSLPAALAVWTLLKPRAFGLYVGFAALTALLAGWGYAAVLAV